MDTRSKLNRSHAIAAWHFRTANCCLAGPEIFDGSNLNDLPILQQKCRMLPIDPKPGLRRRAKAESHMGLDGTITPLKGVPYEQDYEGAVLGPREIAEIDPAIKALASFNSLLREHRALARLCQPELFKEEVREIVHLVSYEPVGAGVSFSHPLNDHADRETHVGMTVLDVSPNLDGGANTLFPGDSRLPSVFIRLEALESLLLGPGCRHQVSAMGSSNGIVANRLIILCTYDPATTALAREAEVRKSDGKAPR